MSIKNEELRYPAANGKDTITAQIWYDDGAAHRCVLQIVHGMCEYMGRYTAFAEYMAKNGVIICGNDHTGHGKSKGADGYGYFADKNGDKTLVQDVRTLNLLIRERYKGLPVFMLGHSMGSFICRNYITRYGEELAGILLSGTSGDNSLLWLGKFLAGAAKLFRGAKHRSLLLTKMSFGNYNDRYEKKRTVYDWISRDEAVVDKYMRDEGCTFFFTAGAYADMFRLIGSISKDAWAKKIPKDKPYCILAGTMDPVGGYTNGVKQVYNRMKNAGVKDITLHLYEGARHEVLNETNRLEVYGDVIAFLNDAVFSPEPVPAAGAKDA